VDKLNYNMERKMLSNYFEIYRINEDIWDAPQKIFLVSQSEIIHSFYLGGAM
jgi:hypothetical protein